LLVIGSDDAGYNPSKVAPYLMSGRPVLAILHLESPACDVVDESGGVCLRFGGPSQDLEQEVFCALTGAPTAAEEKSLKLKELTAEAMTERLARILDAAVTG
jgi:hypothetical protein